MQLPNARKPGKSLGVNYDPNQPKATMGGNRNQPKPPSVPEFKGPEGYTPPGAPSVPPSPATTAPTLPQNQNGPIFDAPQPMAYNGGYYNPTTASFGYDQSQPGQVEQLWSNNQALWFDTPQLDYVDSLLPQYSDPWAGERQAEDTMSTIANPGAGQQYWNGQQGAFNTMGANVTGGYNGKNRAAEAYELTKGMLPGSMQPKFDAYYDRMKEKTMGDVNAQSAARGAYGSSAGLNGSIGAALDVEAQRAKAETDFMLADSANQANWQGILGNQGRNADLSGLGAFDADMRGAQFGLDKMRLGGDLAFRSEEMDFNKKKSQADIAFGLDEARNNRLSTGAEIGLGVDAARLNRANSAAEVAGQAQDAFEDRTNKLYDNISGMSQDVQNFFMNSYDTILSGDIRAVEQEIDAYLAQFADARGWSDTQQDEMKQDLMDAAETYMSVKGIGGYSGGTQKK